MEMAKPIAVRTLKVMEYLRKHPDAPVAKVAGEFNMALSQVYGIRKRVRQEDTPESLDAAFGVSIKDIPDHPAEVATKEAIDKAMNTVTVTSVDSVLNDRAKDYGKFIEGAEIMQMLKRLVHNYIEVRGTQLAFDQREAIDMIIHKLGRIINGNPDKVDHWTDIAGYSKLVADRLEGNVR
jgi:hypothetical protein